MIKKIYKYIVILLISLTVALSLLSCAKKKDPDVEEPQGIKNAFILLPGLMGSALCDPQLGNIPVWGTNFMENLVLNKDIQAYGLNRYLSEVFSFDESGNPLKTMVPADINTEGDDKDGFNGMLTLYRNYLTETYGETYDVVNWQYDWRQSNTVSAEKLEQFINGKGYEHIIFLAHNTGGNVVSKYLYKAENRAKVDLFMPFGCPFYGFHDTLGLLFPEPDELKSDTFGSFLSFLPYDFLVTLASDMPSLYQTLPYAAMYEGLMYDNTSSPVMLDGQKKTFTEIYDYMKTFQFVRTERGNLKKVFSSLITYQNADFISVGGNPIHISKAVPTEYIVGVGVKTTMISDINSETDSILSKSYTYDGDGTVTAYSAAAGTALDSQNVHILQGVKNGDLMKSTEYLDLIKEIISKYVWTVN